MAHLRNDVPLNLLPTQAIEKRADKYTASRLSRDGTTTSADLTREFDTPPNNAAFATRVFAGRASTDLPAAPPLEKPAIPDHLLTQRSAASSEAASEQSLTDEPSTDDLLPPDTVFEVADLVEEAFAGEDESLEPPIDSTSSDVAMDGAAAANSRLEAVGGAGRAGFGAVVQCCGVQLVGEKGTGVPNTSFGELQLAVDLTLTVSFEYSRYGERQVQGIIKHWPIMHATNHQTVLMVGARTTSQT